MATNDKLGVALVGLGRYSEGQLGPALRETKLCYLAGVVSGQHEKLSKWQREYDLKDTNLYTYENFDDIASNKDIDIVYIVLPNALHADYAVRAAKAGKHVICEKPMATTIDDCHRIVAACGEAAVKLSVGYRLHFDPFNKQMMHLGQSKVFGRVEKITADNSMVIDDDEWRLEGALAGGGPLMNNGVYCVQAAIYITGELPISVTASFNKKTSSRFKTIEEGIKWEMHFPSGVTASCESSYSRNGNLLRAESEAGWFQLKPAYEYKGLKGETAFGKMKFPTINQQAAQMDDFARCILNDTESKVSGDMGCRDVEIMMAIYEAARTGKKVDLHLESYKSLIEA